MRHLMFALLGLLAVSGIAHSDAEPAAVSPKQIAAKNLATPKVNLGWLGDIAANKKTDLLSMLSSKAFSQSQKFSDLKDFLRDYKISFAAIAETQTRFFSVKDDDSRQVSVTFEHRADAADGGVWHIKSIAYTKDGNLTPLPPEEARPLYNQTFPVFAEDGDFSAFISAWNSSQVWKKFDSFWGKSMAELVPLPKRQALIQDVIFYAQETKPACQTSKLAFISISFDHFPPDQEDAERGWGWLISDFSAKIYDLTKESDLKPIPIPPRTAK